ncbi:MAG: hypothetical protein J6P98_07735, partial [Clostridia bacterium]|nr:hypothetical protein [Clostridia bacterium]
LRFRKAELPPSCGREDITTFSGFPKENCRRPAAKENSISLNDRRSFKRRGAGEETRTHTP